MPILYLNFVIAILWLLSALADYAQFGYVWQFKEYRFDRLRDYSFSLSGKKFLRGWRVFKRPLIYLVLFFLLPINLKTLDTAVITILFIDLIYNFRAASGHNLLRPKFTVKPTALIISALLIEGALLFLFFDTSLIFLILALRWFIFSALAILAKLPTGLAKLIYLNKAQNKLSKFNKLTIIGVTGSYGKTTVKNFLAQALTGKYRVIMTPENINTEIGVAKFIINNNFSDYNIFIVEMGTYKVGEIAAVCRMVKPKIGILTVISEQHLSLLKTIENTQTAKYELLRSLPADGLAITNSDNKYCREFLAELKCEVKIFGSNIQFNPDCLIKNVSADERGINFTALIKNNGELKISATVPGAHNSFNIAPVILTSLFLGLNTNEIIKQFSQLKLPPKVLQTYAFGQSLILDDSYNANPEGFLAALDVLANYIDRKKIVITRGMLELGTSSQGWHEAVGKKIEQTADELIIISEDSAADLKKGAGNIKIIIETNQDKLLEIIKNYKKQKNIILVENRLPEKVYRELKS
ncbi:MAG: UDP-N-acetylmuramoyl-tripeptide--D-alanyl-D-alanine ligase [bacterium]|nr:UDP-N-acetylmuramoyl-tripeptide--D-alanyl-D-alanine ligase [bacterium]